MDLDGEELHVRRTVIRRRVTGEDGKWRQTPGFGKSKTDKSRRGLALPAATVEALASHRDRQATERKAAGVRWQNFDLVFPTPYRHAH